MNTEKDLKESTEQALTIPIVISRFSNYKKSVMERAWQDFKVKKRHKGYDDWTFTNSLYWAHKHISALKRNGL